MKNPEKDHDLTEDTEVTFYVNTNLVGCKVEEEIQLGVFFTQEELDDSTYQEIEEALNEAATDWVWEQIEVGVNID
jgi:hypothetical protein